VSLWPEVASYSSLPPWTPSQGEMIIRSTNLLADDISQSDVFSNSCASPIFDTHDEATFVLLLLRHRTIYQTFERLNGMFTLHPRFMIQILTFVGKYSDPESLGTSMNH
jgi:hypothetical protein